MDGRMAEIARYPRKEGSFEIEQYLIAGELRPGCWLKSDTVYGDVFCNGLARGTYTLPVFAYLEHVTTIRSDSNTEHEYEVVASQGFSKSFSSSIKKEFSFSATFDTANVAGKISEMSMTKETVSESTSVRRNLKLSGEGTIMVYQIHIVYAHLMTNGGQFVNEIPHNKHFLSYNDEGRLVGNDLAFLSSVVCDQLVPVKAEHAISPLSWKEVVQAVLFDQYEIRPGARRWMFDFSVHNPR